MYILMDGFYFVHNPIPKVYVDACILWNYDYKTFYLLSNNTDILGY